MTTPTLQHANAMPAPTWHRLRVNDATIELPANLTYAREVETRGIAELAGATNAFEAAMANLQLSVYGTESHAATEEHDAAPSSKNASAAAEDTLDQSALSAFQARSIAIEQQRSVAAAFETGMGKETYLYLREAAGRPLIVATSPNQQQAHVAVRIPGVDGAINAAAIDVVAAEGSNLTLTIALDSPQPGTGTLGCSLRVFAGRDSRVSITTTQTLDDTWVVLDDTGLVLDERAHVDIRHTALGASHSYTGLAGDLRGEAAKTTIDTRYQGQRNQELDFNYVLRHRGPKTESTMNANGVLADASKKTLRGTIDFIRGCKQATGQEVETVLLANDEAENRSVPVILCGEDDVAGNHGATIGHVRPEQLFYVACRGLSPLAAERLFTVATFEEAALNAPDKATQASVIRLANTRGITLDIEPEGALA